MIDHAVESGLTLFVMNDGEDGGFDCCGIVVSPLGDKGLLIPGNHGEGVYHPLADRNEEFVWR